MGGVRGRSGRRAGLAGPGLAALAVLGWAGVAAAATAADKFAVEVLAEGLLFTYGLAFVKGLGAVINPCVYPLIPITLTLIGARGAQSRGTSIKNAALYVLGMALMYTSLGVAAAGLGKLFGFTFQSGAIMGVVVVIFLLMGLSMFGAFELRLPAQWTDRLTSQRGQSMKIFLMGLFSGIVAAPCTAPFVFSLLAYVSETQNMSLGASTLFVFSLGLGLPFLVLGAFSGAINKLPRSGPWLVAVKYFFGLAMLAFAAYYLPFAVGTTLAPVLTGAVLVLLGFAAARKTALYDWTDHAFRTGGAVVLLVGLSLFGYGLAGASRVLYAPTNASEGGQIAWLHSESAAVARGRSEAKPVMLDFWATWCTACKELETTTLRDPEVVRHSRGVVAAKVDCTKETPEIRTLYKKYGVQGLPAILFVDKSGAVRHDLTVTEELPAADLITRLQALQ